MVFCLGFYAFLIIIVFIFSEGSIWNKLGALSILIVFAAMHITMGMQRDPTKVFWPSISVGVETAVVLGLIWGIGYVLYHLTPIGRFSFFCFSVCFRLAPTW